MAKNEFSVAFYKMLSKNDSGRNRGHQSGILIPEDLRCFFPDLRATETDPTPGIGIDLIIHEKAGRGIIRTRYQKQTWNMTRKGETRITGNLEEFRRGSGEDDILVMERSYRQPRLYRARIVRRGSEGWKNISTHAGGRRWGVLPTFVLDAPVAERRLVARLDRIEATVRPGCLAFEFDGMDANLSAVEVDRALNDPEVTQPFALVRIICPRGDLEDLLGGDLREGMWTELDLVGGRKAARPSGSIAQLVIGGYLERGTVSVSGISILAYGDEPPRDFPSAGAAAAQRRQRAIAVVSSSGIPVRSVASGAKVTRLLQPLLAAATGIRVRDVGQASFATVQGGDGEQLVHFDAGWPISYNGKTAPKKLPVVTPVPVVLSHWDWDHLHAWHSFPSLRSVKWIVPFQPIGPGATKLARAMHRARRLLTYRGKALTIGGSRLSVCSGPSGANDTGLALDLTLVDGRRALLVGDASYAFVAGASSGATYDLLVVTHHGADFTGRAPKSAGRAEGAVSVGRRNVYGHPSLAALASHAGEGWRISLTSGAKGARRGDRVLG